MIQALRLKYALSGKIAIARIALIKLAFTPEIVAVNVFCTVSASFLKMIRLIISNSIGIIAEIIAIVIIGPISIE